MLQDERAQLMTTQKHQKQYVQRTLFTRCGATSYIGHLDLMKVFERAIRRAELPILYTQGYNPRPMMVFALPLGVGINTEGDYVDVPMAVPVNSEEFVEKVNRELPQGLKILRAKSIPEPKDSLMSVVTAADYRIVSPQIAVYAIKLLDEKSIITSKKSKGKIISIDIRGLIYDIQATDQNTILLRVAAGSSKNLRPDVFMNAVCEMGGYDEQLAKNACITRTALYSGNYPEINLIF